MAADWLQNSLLDIVDRLHVGSTAHMSAQPQHYCNFSLRTVSDGAVRAVLQTLPQGVECFSFLDTHVSWAVHGCEPSGVKRIIISLAECAAFATALRNRLPPCPPIAASRLRALSCGIVVCICTVLCARDRHFFSSAEDLHALLLTLYQESPRGPTEEEQEMLAKGEASMPWSKGAGATAAVQPGAAGVRGVRAGEQVGGEGSKSEECAARDSVVMPSRGRRSKSSGVASEGLPGQTPGEALEASAEEAGEETSGEETGGEETRREKLSKMIDVTFELRALSADGTPAALRQADTDVSLWEGHGSSDKSPDGLTIAFRLWLAQKLVVGLRGTTESSDGGSTCRFRLAYQLQEGLALSAALQHEPRPRLDVSNYIVTPRVCGTPGRPEAFWCQPSERRFAGANHRALRPGP